MPLDPPEEAAALQLLASAQASAALELGRLEGRLSTIDPGMAQIFAALSLRDALHAVLSQEGHRFTEVRFAAWFAGLATLSDEPLQFAASPRGLIEAVLSDFCNAAWEPMALAAQQMATALLAPRDPGDAAARSEAHAALTEAAEIIAASTSAPSPLPFPGLAAVHEAAGNSVRFALRERAPDLLELDNLQLLVERDRPPSPRWPLELSCAPLLHACTHLPATLPLVGLIRLDATTSRDVQSRCRQADALALALRRLNARYEAARAITAEAAALSDKQRATSRAPHLYALLRSLGPLRSAQIERLLSASRLGVRLMLRTLDEARVIEAQTISGAKLYTARPFIAAENPVHTQDARPASFSAAALAEYDASMTEIDALLARYPSSEPQDD